MGKPFRYSLEALLRKRNWDLDALRQQETEAHAIVQSQHAVCEELQAEKCKVEVEIRHGYARNSDIQPELSMVLKEFLREKRDALSLALGQLEKAKAVHAEVMERVLAAKRSVRTLERHRESKEAEYRVEQQREAIRRSDELWLLRRGVAGDE